MAVLHVSFFWCDDVTGEAAKYRAFIDASQALLAPFGVSLEVLPQVMCDPAYTIAHHGDVLGAKDFLDGAQAMNDRANLRVRGAMYQKQPGNGRHPILFGRLSPPPPGFFNGFTVMTYVNEKKQQIKSSWDLPWSIVNPLSASAKSQTLLHEMGHASGLNHSKEGFLVPISDLMLNGGGAQPVTMRAETADALRKSYFCW